MTSFSSFRFELHGDRAPVYQVEADAMQIPVEAGDVVTVQAESPYSFRAITGGLCGQPRLVVGGEVADLSPRRGQVWETEGRHWFWNEAGGVIVRLELLPDSEEDDVVLLLQAHLQVLGRPEVTIDRERIVTDLARVHLGLAQDVLGSTRSATTTSAQATVLLDIQQRIAQLERLVAQLGTAVRQIARNPPSTLTCVHVLDHFRAGDRVTNGLLGRAASWAEHAPAAEVPVTLQKAPMPRLRTSGDLPEHRHIAEGLRRIRRDAEALGRYCRRKAGAHPGHWGGPQRHEPRVVVLREHAVRAGDLAHEATILLEEHPFLRGAQRPRTPLRLTPLFASRTAYREAFRALLSQNRTATLLVDAESMLFTCRSLSQLYEYWCFVKTISVLRDIYGPPVPAQTFELVDDIYCPDLRPGQRFTFPLHQERSLSVTYEPEIPPLHEHRRFPTDIVSTLSRGPLRPDVLVRLSRPGQDTVFMALDAKSVDDFSPRRFREMSNYLLQVVDPRTGRQPVTHTYLLHRDRHRRPLVNVPGYLDGVQLPRGAKLLGAMPLVPAYPEEAVRSLAWALERFLRDSEGATP